MKLVESNWLADLLNARCRLGLGSALAILALGMGMGMGQGAAHEAHGVHSEMALAARTFLSSLTPEQKARATFRFADAERVNWHFIPRERRGVSLKEMAPAQRHLAYGLIGTGLSQRGNLKAMTIMALERVLLEMEAGSGAVRDPERYYLSIFGEPSEEGTWGWRVEGHHLSVNLTLIEGKAYALTPSFMGSNPARVPGGPLKGLRVLGREEDLARELLNSLNAEQRTEAVIAETAPRDVILGPDRAAAPLASEGLAVERMNDAQRRVVRALLREYLFRHRQEWAEEYLSRIHEAGLDRVIFAWAGSLEPGEGHYYRLQGPTFILEYDNTQNRANHVHTVWRDFKDDFGADLLREHYLDREHSE